MLSVVILTHQEEEKEIQKCLDSVAWADEVLQISDEDKPLEDDFSAKRNWGLARARGDWVLFLDPDEEVSPALSKEIRTIIKNGSPRQGYYLKRQDYFMGRWLSFGETRKVRLLRLGKKTAGQWKRKVHEYWDIPDPGLLNNNLKHYSHPTLKSFMEKVNLYSSIDAGEIGSFKLTDMLKPLAKFIENYFLRLGFFDGIPGLVMAIMMSIYSLTVRVKQYENGLS